MNADKWFESGCDYQEGVLLYASLQGCKPNLLRLFMKKHNAYNQDKLKSELSKYRQNKPKTAFKESTLPSRRININIDTSPKLTPENKAGFYKLNEIHTDLHHVLIKQRNDFQLAISSHEQLIKLHADQEAEALELCIKIEDLFDSIEQAQKILDHYVEHGNIMKNKTKDYSGYSGARLYQAKKNTMASISKYKKRVEATKTALDKTTLKAEKNKLEKKLSRESNKLLEHEVELSKITEIMNGNE